MKDEMKCSMEQKSGNVLQARMVPINIVNLCRDLGLRPRGFYQPGYHNEAKLNLEMMCLGKNGDLETS
ncbi:hypothetical protein ACFX11_024912 [Malus domestica]